MIIDLGAGTSGYSEALLHCRRVISIDLSFSALNANKALPNKVSSINADALSIPLKDNSASKILLIGMLHHVPFSLPQLLQEVSRVLKKGGAIYIDEPNGYNIMWFVFMRLCEIDKVGARPLFPHFIKKVARNNHLSIDKELYWGFVPPGLNRESAVDIFDKISSVIEKSFLIYAQGICLLLRNRIYCNQDAVV